MDLESKTPFDVSGTGDVEAQEYLLKTHVAWGVSWRGRGHRLRGTARQDAVALTTTESGVLVAAVADGVGSQAKSAFGARIAADTAVAQVREQSDRDELPPPRSLRVAFKRARSAVATKAEQIGVPVEELASTLIVASVTWTADSMHLAASWTGDGMILVFRRCNEPLQVCLRSETGGPPDSVVPVASTTGSVLLRNSEQVELPGHDWTIAVMTDGIADDFAGRADDLCRAIDAVRSLPILLRSIGYRRKGSHDDRSIVVVRPRRSRCPAP